MKSIVCTLSITRIQARYLSLFCLFLLASNLAIAQENNKARDTIISEKLRSYISESDSIYKIEEFIQDTFDQEKDTILGLAYCKIYLERGKKEKNDAIQLFSNYQMAYMLYNQSDHNEALKRAHISTKLAEKVKDTASIISSNVLLGSTLYVLGVHDEALKFYLVGKELATHTKNSPYELICLTNIANIRAKLHQYQEALDDYNSILKILDESEQNIATRFSALLGKMLCLTELKRFEEAEKVFDLGTRIAKKNKFKITEGSFNINLGRVYYEKGEYHTSLGYLRQGKEMLKATSLQNNLYITDFYIAKNLSKQEAYEEALSLLDTIFERIGDDTNTDRIEEMYDLAIKISKILEDETKELEYRRRSEEIKQAKNDKEKAARELLHKDDLNDFAIENKKLAHEKTQSLTDKKIIMAVSILLVSILLMIFLFYHRKAKLKEQKFLAIIEDISKKTTPQKTKKPQKTAQSSAIKDEKANAILEELETLESTHFYLSPDVTLHTTAKLVHTNTTYLSKALNTVKKQSFSQYLNKLRIDYVLVKLKEDAVFRSYTIHAISKEIGYKSATTFIKEFKNKTGLNPSYYIKKIES